MVGLFWYTYNVARQHYNNCLCHVHALCMAPFAIIMFPAWLHSCSCSIRVRSMHRLSIRHRGDWDHRHRARGSHRPYGVASCEVWVVTACWRAECISTSINYQVFLNSGCMFRQNMIRRSRVNHSDKNIFVTFLVNTRGVWSTQNVIETWQSLTSTVSDVKLESGIKVGRLKYAILFVSVISPIR